MRVIPAKSYRPVEVGAPAESYTALKERILGIMVVLSGVVTLTLVLVYGGDVGLSYGVGACSGVVYWRMLARSVDRLGTAAKGWQFGSPRLAVFIAVMIVALRWDKLAVLPVFFGFVTYKAAILLYAIYDLIRSSRTGSP
ncbi:MAG: ATP synthase subunit I [Pseudanabaenaceae cyanobacterium]